MRVKVGSSCKGSNVKDRIDSEGTCLEEVQRFKGNPILLIHSIKIFR